MTSSITTVSWETYAQQYDMLMNYNPYYQDLHREVMEHIRTWNIPKGSTLADIGAGTGNYSLAMARQVPQATILHFDNDEGMNAATLAKRPARLNNHQTYCVDADRIDLPSESLSGLISIHALYTFPDPKTVLRKMYDWLEPGAPIVLVDPGRLMNVLSWQLAIGWHLLREYGLAKTLNIMQQGREVSKQNARIRDMQRKGVFWMHTHEEFNEAVREAGFRIVESKVCFREASDLVVAEKPVSC